MGGMVCRPWYKEWYALGAGVEDVPLRNRERRVYPALYCHLG
jgi:hypothetical protein